MSFADEESPDSVYYDLVRNPERFTGYTGPGAVNVWKLIYDQNCFKYESPARCKNLATHLDNLYFLQQITPQRRKILMSGRSMKQQTGKAKNEQDSSLKHCTRTNIASDQST